MATTDMTVDSESMMDGLLHPSTMPTPSRKSSAKSNQEEIIVWDDPPSSPFMTEVGDTSRNVSNKWSQSGGDPEIDAIFEDGENNTNHGLTAMVENGLEAEKENEAPIVDMNQTTATPKKHYRESMPSTVTREQEQKAMPPPSTTRKMASPTKRATIAQTPLHSRSHRAVPMSARSTTQRDHFTSIEDSSFAPDETNIDDTCFSTFSAVPEMTVFARLGENRSPMKGQRTPRASEPATPRTLQRHQASSRSPSPTPRRNRSPTKDGNTTSLLLDFTQQMDAFSMNNHQSPTRTGRLSPSRTEPNLLSHLNNQRSPAKSRMSAVSPSKQSSLMNLLDFELPPPPTPRSAPAFSAREVESLKSSFQSQISSIKAKLSGKEAEVDALKKALEDAERRVGESQEAARTEKVKREQAEQEKADWEKRGLDVENVLLTVKEEVLKSEAEKEGLERRAEECERRAQECERRAGDAEARNLDLQARLASLPAGENGESGVNGEGIQRLVQAQLDSKIESVSRELHAVYKKKHETKVATLKKSYEARNEKKCSELQAQVEELRKQNECLMAAKDATHSDEHPSVESYRAELEEQNAKLVGFDQEIRAMRHENSRLLAELEQERAEKGELVAAVDEMLSLQASDAAPAVIEDFRKSISRTPGLRPPRPLSGGMPESKIGRGLPTGISRAPPNKSRMMTSIEKMGMGSARQ
ncbi:hypothetical protein MBLNU457_5823t1 [Dothideomycetes sp. NU457]